MFNYTGERLTRDSRYMLVNGAGGVLKVTHYDMPEGTACDIVAHIPGTDRLVIRMAVPSIHWGWPDRQLGPGSYLWTDTPWVEVLANPCPMEVSHGQV